MRPSGCRRRPLCRKCVSPTDNIWINRGACGACAYAHIRQLYVIPNPKFGCGGFYVKAICAADRWQFESRQNFGVGKVVFVGDFFVYGGSGSFCPGGSFFGTLARLFQIIQSFYDGWCERQG